MIIVSVELLRDQQTLLEKKQLFILSYLSHVGNSCLVAVTINSH